MNPSVSRCVTRSLRSDRSVRACRSYPLSPDAGARRGTYDAAYWSRNIRQTVRFAPAIDQLLRDGFGLFLEVGPHPALGVPVLAMAAQCKVEVVASASLRRGQPARSSMLGSLCELYEGGARVAWQQLAEPGARTVPLPAYPWQRRRHWLESPDASALAFHVTGQRYEDGRMMLRASATA